MTLPTVTVVMTTYLPPNESDALRRMDAEREAVSSWAMRLNYDGPPLRLHIADDGSDGATIDRLVGWSAGEIGASARRPWERVESPTFTQQARHGVGASLNAGFERAHRDGGIALYLVDDWRLLQPFDLTPWVQLLLDDESVGMVRLGPPHPWLTGTVEAFPSGWGVRLDRHHFAFGHRPALYHPRMRDAYGRFAEDVNAYECERLYNERFCEQPGPDVVLALPEVWRPIESIELADVEPRGAQ